MVIIFTTRQNTNGKNIKSSEINNSHGTPEPVGPYSKYKKTGNLYFFSGQIGINPYTNELEKGGIKEEAIQVCRNIKALLQEVDLGLKDVIKTTIFLKNINDFDIVNEVYKDYFILKPARSTVEVSNLPKGASIEIEVIASHDILNLK
ncbi:hypothetical protein HGA92_03290 [Candidatus Gracilibacteria bacterium]|nr:hypothetical protein [Candidatus Gracilibacteria bacterium]NUJ99122.1 hypothetical protein [Candidatus Gracilibacteria bacterium]